jgi:putative sterol carrier protein
MMSDKPDITITLKDSDFVEIFEGRLTGQKAFTKGLVKIAGKMMLAMKLDKVLVVLGGGQRVSKM